LTSPGSDAGADASAAADAADDVDEVSSACRCPGDDGLGHSAPVIEGAALVAGEGLEDAAAAAADDDDDDEDEDEDDDAEGDDDGPIPVARLAALTVPLTAVRTPLRITVGTRDFIDDRTPKPVRLLLPPPLVLAVRPGRLALAPRAAAPPTLVVAPGPAGPPADPPDDDARVAARFAAASSPP